MFLYEFFGSFLFLLMNILNKLPHTLNNLLNMKRRRLVRKKEKRKEIRSVFKNF